MPTECQGEDNICSCLPCCIAEQQSLPCDSVRHLKSQPNFSVSHSLPLSFSESSLKNALEWMKLLHRWKLKEGVPFWRLRIWNASFLPSQNNSCFYFSYICQLKIFTHCVHFKIWTLYPGSELSQCVKSRTRGLPLPDFANCQPFPKSGRIHLILTTRHNFHRAKHRIFENTCSGR